MVLSAALAGFAAMFALIVAIGAQNAFVLRQGLMRSHVLWVCLVCALSDSILIAVGVAGMAGIGAAIPWLISALTWAGAAFLFAYGLMSLRRAFNPDTLRAKENGNGTLSKTLLTCLALAWLNPHVYLDTVGLIGAVSAGFPDWSSKIAYGSGAALASFVFFFGLGYGARLLAPIFARPRAWAILDVIIALIMWSIAATLLLDQGAFA